MNRHTLTPEGFDRISLELKHCKEVKRAAIVRDIEEARAHGDLSENSEYDDAKERQSLYEGRINLLESVCAAADIIDVTKLPQNGRVVFGTTVVLEEVDSGITRTWRVVGEPETDVENGCISFKSPVAKAMIGRSVGDEVVVPAPGGRRTWEILDVKYLGPSES